ncbi:MAG: T9SS type A sorting domain-containing protein [Bacteroidia bacterium]
MKKLIITSIAFIASFALQAQISIVREDFAVPNEWYLYGYDTSGNDLTTLLESGANKTWDLRGKITTHTKDTSYFANGMSYPTAPAGCNLVQYTIDRETGERSEEFYAVSNNELRIIFDGSGDLPVPGALRVLKFPANYLTNFKDSMKSEFTALAEDFGIPTNPLFDSAKIVIRLNMDAILDGWGKLQFTSNTFDVLRQKNTIDINIKFFVRNRLNGQYTVFPGFPEQNERVITYSWFGKNGGNYYLQIETDNDGNLGDVKFMLASSRGLINSINKQQVLTNTKVWPNPVNDILNISFNSNTSAQSVIEVYDVIGNLVYQTNTAIQTGENTLNILVTNLTSGIYFYNIKGSNFSQTGKWLKN